MFLTYGDTRPVNQNKHLSIIDERGLLPICVFFFNFLFLFLFFETTHEGAEAQTGLRVMSQLKEKELKSRSIAVEIKELLLLISFFNIP